MHRAVHPYLRFRIRLAHHALLHVVASLKSSAEIIVLAFAPVLLGLFACIALPGLIAPTLPWPQALALVAAQAGVAALPAVLLRKRLHPADVLQWSRPLPVAPALRWLADAAVAAMLMAPLTLVYAISTAIWLYQWPDWLRPVAAASVGLTVLSLLLAWGASTLVLARRARMPAAAQPRRGAPPAAHYAPRPLRPFGFYLWHQLFWLPFWRADNVVGMQQSWLLLGALASVATWRLHPAPVPPVLWGALSSLLLMVLTDRGDKAVREQTALLRPIIASWPIRSARLFFTAAVFGLLPAAAVLAGYAALMLHASASKVAGLSSKAAAVWLCTAALAQVALVAPRHTSARGRVGLVFGAILTLTAIGSELWN